MEREAGILHRDGATAERGGQQPERLHVAAADHDPLGVGEHAAGAAEVRGERGAQLDPPARVAEPQRRVRRLA
jgi:hypothetical protein